MGAAGTNIAVPALASDWLRFAHEADLYITRVAAICRAYIFSLELSASCSKSISEQNDPLAKPFPAPITDEITDGQMDFRYLDDLCTHGQALREAAS